MSDCLTCPCGITTHLIHTTMKLYGFLCPRCDTVLLDTYDKRFWPEVHRRSLEKKDEPTPVLQTSSEEPRDTSGEVDPIFPGYYYDTD